MPMVVCISIHRGFCQEVPSTDNRDTWTGKEMGVLKRRLYR